MNPFASFNPNIVVPAAVVISLAVGLAVGYAFKSRVQKVRGGAGQVAVSAAFLKGLNYLISNNQDKAIEEFTRAVKVDSDTIETYVALGNLYRSKGEIERAIRIRQSIILRQGVSEEIKQQALFDLGMDYRRGGFIDRAIATYNGLLKVNPSRLDVYQQLEQLYEETRDWSQCIFMRQKISKLQSTDDRNILAHYHTEMGKTFFAAGDLHKAEDCFDKAIGMNKLCVDAYLHLSDLFIRLGEMNKALNTLKKMVSVAPEKAYMAVNRLDRMEKAGADEEKLRKFITENVRGKETAAVRQALARYWISKGKKTEALEELRAAVEESPRFLPARKLMGTILIEEHLDEESLAQYRALIRGMEENPREYQCSHCGYTSSELTWKCPQCLQWDTMEHVEIVR